MRGSAHPIAGEAICQLAADSVVDEATFAPAATRYFGCSETCWSMDMSVEATTDYIEKLAALGDTEGNPLVPTWRERCTCAGVERLNEELRSQP